jgi:hypothetical protein
MSSTVIGLTKTNSAFDYFEGAHSLRINGMHGPYMFMMPFLEDPVPESDKVLTIKSTKEKVLISLSSGPYHFFNDSVGPALKALDDVPNAEVYIDVANIWFDRHNLFYDFFFKVIRDKGFTVYEVDTRGYDAVNVSNFHVMITNQYVANSGNRVFEAYKHYVKDKNVEPYRNVYLSRKYMGDRDWSRQLHDGLSAKHDNRIDNEKILERYFAEKGFEIICPEDFKSFEDQINFFYSVKTLVSLTSSGLTNAFFMQPNNTMVELMTPLVTFHDQPGPDKLAHAQEAIHHFYQLVATNRGHKYIGIPNMPRSAEKIVETIESDDAFRTFFDKTDEM